MSSISVGELVRLAKGEDRSLREYARDTGIDAAILSRMINGTYIPKKPRIYEALTNPQASPRGGVTFEQMIAGGYGSSESASLAMKPEEIRRIQRVQNEAQRFAAIANGIILGSLGRKGLTFQLVQTGNSEIDGIHFDTCVRLMNHAVSEYLIRYAFISDEEAVSDPLAINTLRRVVEELVFLNPQRNRIVSVVTNHPGAYDDLCGCKDRLSYNGELSALLFDLERAMILKEEYISH